MGLAEKVAARFGNATRYGVTDATLKKITSGIREPDAQSAGTNPTTVEHACKAFAMRFTSTQIDGTTVKSDDRMIVILAATIANVAVPEVGDKITIEGQTFNIVGGRDGLGVHRDSASIRYRCHARR